MELYDEVKRLLVELALLPYSKAFDDIYELFKELQAKHAPTA